MARKLHSPSGSFKGVGGGAEPRIVALLGSPLSQVILKRTSRGTVFSLFPRIEYWDFIRVIAGVPCDEDQVVGERGGRDEAVENRQAAALALLPGAELSPFAHDLASRWKQAIFGPVLQSLKPCGNFIFSFTCREKFDALDHFAKRDGGKMRFVIVGIQPVHDRFIGLGV